MADRQLDLLSAEDTLTAFVVRESTRARRMSIRVTPWRGVEVVVPRRTRPAEIEAFVRANRRWIERTSVELARTAPSIDFSPPQSVRLPAIDIDYEVAYRPATGAGKPCVQEDGPQLTVIGAANDVASTRLLRNWLRVTARRVLPVVLREVAAMTGLEYRRVQVRGQRTRWGSCSTSGTISLNFCLMFLGPELMRYLMVHELCHTRHMNHSRAFWSLVGSHVADPRRFERRLDTAWRDIPGWVGLH